MSKDTPTLQHSDESKNDNRFNLYDNLIRDMHEIEMERTLKNFIEARKMYEDIVANGKQKIDQQYHQLHKGAQAKQRIHRSSLINRSHMMKAELRSKMCEEVFTAVLHKVKLIIESDQQEHCLILIKLTVQGALRMFQPQLTIRCLPNHTRIVEKILQSAEYTFNSIMEQQTGRVYPIKLKINYINSLKQRSLSAKDDHQQFSKKRQDQQCAGGVILSDLSGNIIYKNTIDTRINILRQVSLPMLRVMLWPNLKQPIQNGKVI